MFLDLQPIFGEWGRLNLAWLIFGKITGGDWLAGLTNSVVVSCMSLLHWGRIWSNRSRLSTGWEISDHSLYKLGEEQTIDAVRPLYELGCTSCNIEGLLVHQTAARVFITT